MAITRQRMAGPVAHIVADVRFRKVSKGESIVLENA